MSLSRRAIVLAPLAVAGAFGAASYAILGRMEQGRFDPHALDNPLVGKPFPDFTLPGLGQGAGFTASELRQAAAATPILVNFFASWCIPCATEADVLAQLKAQGINIWGVAYKDKPDAARKFLERYGNPYTRTAADLAGRVAIDWGLYGVPESFLIGKDGRIAWHIAGPLSESSVKADLLPALAKATS